MDGQPLLRVEHSVKRYALRRLGLRRSYVAALDDVSVAVRRGECVGLVGESGSGKSTLGRCVLNLTPLDAGRIVFQGREIQALGERDWRPLRRQLQMVFQNPLTSFNPMMTIEQSLQDALRHTTGMEAAARRNHARVLLEQVQLDQRFAGLYPYELSGGQLQRAAIARALAPGPDFLFLDEPTAALDMSIKGQIVNLLRDLQRRHERALIFVSHDLRAVRYVADRMCVMYQGQVVEQGSRAAVFDRPRHPYTRALLAATLIGRGARAASTAPGGDGESAERSPEGCRLVGRCPFAQERCRREPQELRPIAPGHEVRCWRSEELPAAERVAGSR